MRASRFAEIVGEGLFQPHPELMVSQGLQIPGITITSKHRVGAGTYLVRFRSSIVGPSPVAIFHDGAAPIDTYNRSYVLTSPISGAPDLGVL